MMRIGKVHAGAGIFLASASACTMMAVLLWPGIAVFDTLSQYQQALSGQYDDWHPPIMARLWAALIALGWRGSGALLLLQLVVFWSGLALVGAALARRGHTAAGWAVLLAGLMPVVTGWMAVVIKDAELVAVLTLATGLAGWFWLDDRKLPRWAAAIVVILLAYAVLVRANSAFAVVPLAWSWQGWAGLRRSWARGLLTILSLGIVFAAAGPINHRLLGADTSNVAHTLPIYDLAGIAHNAGLQTLPGVAPSAWREAERRHCYTPFYWDPFGDGTKCGPIGDILTEKHGLNGFWIQAIAAHPIAYARHRLMHFNSNLRFLAPANELSAAASGSSQPNDLSLGIGATPLTVGLAGLTRAVAATPLGSPFAWLTASLALLWALAGAAPGAPRKMGMALALSASVMTMSFVVVSIASDLRYHLWLIVATILAATMTAACRDVPRRRLGLGAALLAVVCLVEILARLTLAVLPALGLNRAAER